MHCKSYYSLDIAYFKSSLDAGLLDLLWAKYWVSQDGGMCVLVQGADVLGRKGCK